MTEDGGQKTGDRRQRTDDRKQKIEGFECGIKKGETRKVGS
jgi:hypothetical protein